MGYLKATAEAGKFDLPAALTKVIAEGGPGAWRQAWQIATLALFRRGFGVQDYYDFALWRPAEGRVLRRELVPAARYKQFNHALRLQGVGPSDEAIDDKLATEALLLGAGLPAVRSIAAFAPDGTDLPGHVRRLATAAEVAAFLAAPGVLPMFGKPRADSFARGAAAIVAADGASVTFQSGQKAPVAALAAEIVADYPAGYLFQPFHQCAAGLRDHVGPAMASLRVATLRSDRGVEPWYGVLRVPAKRAMHDGDARSQRVWALVDLNTGTVGPLRDLKDAMAAPVTHWMDRERPLTGLVLPHWQAALEVSVAAHALYPGHGLLGWDLFLTDGGVLISETNANPGPVYQPAARRGMLNPDMAPMYARALAWARAQRR
jgi:hypothetical protein